MDGAWFPKRSHSCWTFRDLFPFFHNDKWCWNVYSFFFILYFLQKIHFKVGLRNQRVWTFPCLHAHRTRATAMCCISSILRNIAGSVQAWKNYIFLFTFPPNLMVKKGIFVLIYIKILFRKYFQIWDTKQLFSKDVFQYFTLDFTYPIVPKYTSVTRSVLLAAQAMGSIIIKWEYP